jgi:hypothetical protein
MFSYTNQREGKTSMTTLKRHAQLQRERRNVLRGKVGEEKNSKICVNKVNKNNNEETSNDE